MLQNSYILRHCLNLLIDCFFPKQTSVFPEISFLRLIGKPVRFVFFFFFLHACNIYTQSNYKINVCNAFSPNVSLFSIYIKKQQQNNIICRIEINCMHK